MSDFFNTPPDSAIHSPSDFSSQTNVEIDSWFNDTSYIFPNYRDSDFIQPQSLTTSDTSMNFSDTHFSQTQSSDASESSMNLRDLDNIHSQNLNAFQPAFSSQIEPSPKVQASNPEASEKPKKQKKPYTHRPPLPEEKSEKIKKTLSKYPLVQREFDGKKVSLFSLNDTDLLGISTRAAEIAGLDLSRNPKRSIRDLQEWLYDNRKILQEYFESLKFDKVLGPVKSHRK